VTILGIPVPYDSIMFLSNNYKKGRINYFVDIMNSVLPTNYL
jgi:hypothetical protein